MMPMAEVLMVTAASLVLLILVCIVRAARGPTTPDRAVALDTINTLAVAALVVLGTAFNEIIFIDVAIIYAMLSFVTTLYIAKYLEGNA